MTRQQEIELPKRVNVVYLTRLSNYQSAMQYAQREVTSSLEAITLDLPVVCDDQIGKNIADITLFSNWMARTSYQFNLGVKYAQLEPSDVITATVEGITHRLRITSTRMATPNVMRVQGVAEDASTYDFYTTPGASTGLLQQNNAIPIDIAQPARHTGFPRR